MNPYRICYLLVFTAGMACAQSIGGDYLSRLLSYFGGAAKNWVPIIAFIAGLLVLASAAFMPHHSGNHGTVVKLVYVGAIVCLSGILTFLGTFN